MRIFLYEYSCATPQVVAASFRREGRAMLAAIREDFSRVPGVELVTLTEGCALDEDAFRERARAADLSMVIAPELDDVLYTRCRWVHEAGGRLLGPSLEAIRLTSDKCALAEHLASHGIRTPQVWSGERLPPIPPPWVWKPRFGAGSVATFQIQSAEEWATARSQVQSQHGSMEAIFQHYVPGQPVSVAFLAGPGNVVPLLPCSQELPCDGRFRYQGGRVPIPDDLAQRAQNLATQVVACVSGLCGYVGVDLVLTDSPDVTLDTVIEVNPRLTTSYIGLRRICRANLAEAMLRVAQSEPIDPLLWKSGSVRFSADGGVEEQLG